MSSSSSSAADSAADADAVANAAADADGRGRIVLARHGETEWSRDGRHTGRSDIPLTITGEEQARRLGRALAGRTFDMVLVSPLQRALRTAQIAGFAGFENEPNLVEWDYGEYEGRSTEDISAVRGRAWTVWQAAANADPAFGESLERVGQRADAVFDRLAPTLERGADALLIAHGHLLRVLAARWLGLPAAAGALLTLGTDSLSRLGFEHGNHVIEVWNAPT